MNPEGDHAKCITVESDLFVYVYKLYSYIILESSLFIYTFKSYMYIYIYYNL